MSRPSVHKLTRCWETLGGSDKSRRSRSQTFRFLQFNVLADGLAQNGGFIKVGKYPKMARTQLWSSRTRRAPRAFMISL
jgi:hypothetical protein